MENNSPTLVYSWALAQLLPILVKTKEKMKTHVIHKKWWVTNLLADIRRNAPQGSCSFSTHSDFASWNAHPGDIKSYFVFSHLSSICIVWTRCYRGSAVGPLGSNEVESTKWNLKGYIILTKASKNIRQVVRHTLQCGCCSICLQTQENQPKTEQEIW